MGGFALTENFRSVIQARQGTGPAGLMTGTYALTASQVKLSRKALSSMMVRDPWRSTAANLPILSSKSMALAFDVSDGENCELMFDAMGDPGRATDVAGTRTWKVGRPSDVRRFDFALLPVEGGDLELREAALVQAQIVLERGRMLSCFTEWQGRELTTDHDAWTATDIGGTNYAGALDATVDFDGESGPVFAFAISVNRDLRAANFTLAGVAQNWKGSLTPDVVGRIIVRTDAAEFAAMMMGGTYEKEITVTLTAGAKVRTITLPRCICEVGERQLIARGTYEHVLEFALLREAGQDALTITSTTP